MNRAITTHHTLLTSDWTSDVRKIETAVGRFSAGRGVVPNDCGVVFFEVLHDHDLHVNVTHKHKTKAVKGWAGPASVARGFVNNRTFGDSSAGQIAAHIREMIFAAKA